MGLLDTRFRPDGLQSAVDLCWISCFIGNIGSPPAFSQMLQQLVSRHEVLAGVAASQVISNVSASLLLFWIYRESVRADYQR